MIGLFDSGVGGLSVFKELYKLMPNEDYIFVADTAHCPYGRKMPEEIINRAEKISQFLIDNGCNIVVVACNTATAAAIKYLRAHFNIPFVGMEPAVKPAALESKTGTIGVLATAGTFKGSLYLHTLAKFATNVKVIEQIGDGLVELVESGKTSGSEVDTLLHKYIDPMINACADHIVLGCTHYPFLENSIQTIAGKNVTIVNPAPAVAHQAKKILEEKSNFNINKKVNTYNKTFISTGNTSTLKKLAKTIISDIPDENFKTLNI